MRQPWVLQHLSARPGDLRVDLTCQRRSWQKRFAHPTLSTTPQLQRAACRRHFTGAARLDAVKSRLFHCCPGDQNTRRYLNDQVTGRYLIN